MKSPDDAGDDDIYDPIKLNFDVNAHRLENVEFLDPGIIELECESDEDFHFIDEDTTDIDLTGGATSLESVTTTAPNNVSLKPMCIQLVDCFKFPWYFDQFTKNIIKNKLSISNGVNINDQIMDASSNNINNVDDVADGNAFCESLDVNGTSGSTNDVNSNELSNYSNNWAQAIDINQIRGSLDIKLRVHNHIKRLAHAKMKNDLELLNAMRQRNKTGVDIKRNTGLVGMKVKRMTTKKNVGLVGTKIKHMMTEQTSNNTKCKTNNQTDTNKERRQETNNMYIQAVDKALINIGTTIAPVSIDIGRDTKNSELCKRTVSQDVRVNSSDSYSKKDLKRLKNAKNGTNLIDISTHRDKIEEDMLQLNNKTAKIAEEIVRIIITESGGLGQVDEGYQNSKEKKKFTKPMPYSKKKENEQKYVNLDKIKENLKQQKDTKEGKSTKMIRPMPFSTKKRNKEKLPKANKLYEVQEKIPPFISSSSTPKSNNTSISTICIDSHDMKKQEKEKSNVIPFKPASSNRRSDFHMSSKSFPTLNKFTENILSKIQAKKKSNMLGKKKSQNQNTVVQLKSTFEQKLISGVCPTKSNVTNEQSQVEKTSKIAIPGTQPLDKTAKEGSTVNKGSEKVTMSPEMTFNQPQNSKKHILEHSTKRKLPHLDPYHNILQSMLPLNTIVMNTAKTDGAKINVDTSSINSTHSNSPGNKTKTFEEHSTTNTISETESQKQSLKVLTSENNGSVDKNMKIKETMKQPVVPQEPNTGTSLLLENRFAIQTVNITQNELDAGGFNYAANNFTHQTHVPKTQLSAIIIRPTQTQNDRVEANKPLTVHNSMQSHILYRPQTESRSPSTMYPNNIEALCYQNPVLQMNQAPVSSMCHPSGFTEMVASLEAIGNSTDGFNGGIPAQMPCNMNRPGIDEKIIPKIEMNSKAVKVDDGTTSQSVIDERHMPLGLKGPILPLMKMNVRNPGFILPHAVMNNSLMLAGASETVLQEIKTIPGGNRMIPTQMAFNNRPTPPGVCDVQPNTVFWSSAFPPPKLPPHPPAFPPNSQETKGFSSSMDTISSSIIGRNNEGIVKKINISAQVFEYSTEIGSKEGIVKLNCTPNGEILAVTPENSRVATTKSEMLQVLDTSMHQMKSAVEPLPFISKPSHNNLKSSQYSPSIERLSNLSKHEKPNQNVQPIPSESNENKNIKQEVLPRFNEAVKIITIPVEPNTKRVIQPKTPQVKSIRSSDSYSAKPLEHNPKPVDTYKTLIGTSRLSKDIKSKAISNILENTYTGNNKRGSPQIEVNRKVCSSPKTNVASPVTLKRALTMDPFKNTSGESEVKYKPGPLSKKLKANNPRGRPSVAKNEQKPNRGYSAPILPIPTYEKIMSEVPTAFNKPFDKPIVELSKNTVSSNKVDDKMKRVNNMNSNKSAKKSKHDEQSNPKVYKAKKISLEEYKKRSASDRKSDEPPINNDSFHKKTVDMPRRMSHADSDLGYDSDSTVKL